MNKNPSTEKIWLVKSSGMILGPFSIEELIEALKKKEVSLIDEVRSTDNRWGFVREHQQFVDIVKMLRDHLAQAKEDTGQTLADSTLTQTDAEDTWGPKDDTGKTDSSITPISAILKQSLKSAPPVSEPEQVSNPEAGSSAQAPVTPVYAHTADLKVQQKFARDSKKSTLMIWGVFFFVVVAAGAFLTFRSKDPTRGLSHEDYLKLARTHKNMGRYEKALEYYKKAEASRPLDNSSKLQMAPLLMAVENQNVQARQNLENILLTSNPDPRTKQEIQSLVALSYLREVQLDEAEKRYRELLTSNPQDDVAKMNLLEIQILQGDFDGAAKKITDLIRQGSQDPLLTLYRALVLYRGSSDAAKLKLSEEDLTRFLSRSQDFEPEVLLLRAAIQKKLNQQAAVTAALTELLNTYPDLTKEHFHDFLIHREILQWSYLANVCEILLHDAPTSALFSGLRSYCSYQSGDLKAALQSIDQARLQNAQEPTLIGLNAFLLMKAGRTSEARALFQLPAAQDSPVIHSVKARLCQEQQDYSCAEEQWRILQTQDPRSVETLAGLATVLLAKGKKEMARDLIKQGLLISANYQPLIELRDHLNEP